MARQGASSAGRAAEIARRVVEQGRLIEWAEVAEGDVESGPLVRQGRTIRLGGVAVCYLPARGRNSHTLALTWDAGREDELGLPVAFGYIELPGDAGGPLAARYIERFALRDAARAMSLPALRWVACDDCGEELLLPVAEAEAWGGRCGKCLRRYREDRAPIEQP